MDNNKVGLNDINDPTMFKRSLEIVNEIKEDSIGNDIASAVWTKKSLPFDEKSTKVLDDAKKEVSEVTPQVSSAPTSSQSNGTITKDHQQLVLAGVLVNSYLLALVDNEMNESFFNDSTCRIIYKSLSSYYQKYQKGPSRDELVVAIEDNFINLGPRIDDVKKKALELYTRGKKSNYDESFIIDKAIEMIRKIKVSRTLGETLDQIRNNSSLNEDRLVNNLVKSMSVNLDSASMFTLSDIKKLGTVRKNAMGDETENGRSTIIKSILDTVNQSLTYGGYQIGTLNLIVSPPATGKTSFMVNEGAYAAQQGFYVAHIFLGDMLEYDGFVRYASCISGKLQADIVKMSLDEQIELVKQVNEKYPGIFDRCDTISFASGEKTVNEITEMLKKNQERNHKHYDLVIIDYADNFRREMDNMYIEGGIVYDKLSLFGKLNKSAMLVATQPKISYWSTELMPMEAAGESSKKQHVVDLQLNYNRNHKGANFGSVYIAKMRRGVSGAIARVKTEWERCKMIEITEEEYKQLCVNAGSTPSMSV